MENKPLVLFSGGLDSFLSLLIAIKECGNATPLFFNYGQNPYKEEKKAVVTICKKLNVELVEINLTSLKSLLECPYTTGEDAIEDEVYKSYVPNRNLLFLTLASNYAKINGYTHIYTGFYFKEGKTLENLNSRRVCDIVSDLERENYEITTHPDQTKEFIASVSTTLSLSMEDDTPIVVNPLENFDKADIYLEIQKLGGIKMAVANTYSCYSKSISKNYWGTGCGSCVSCESRKRAWDVLVKNYCIDLSK